VFHAIHLAISQSRATRHHDLGLNRRQIRTRADYFKYQVLTYTDVSAAANATFTDPNFLVQLLRPSRATSMQTITTYLPSFAITEADCFITKAFKMEVSMVSSQMLDEELDSILERAVLPGFDFGDTLLNLLLSTRTSLSQN
jgi:hypothetical protein